MWVWHTERNIVRCGDPLDADFTNDARKLGVRFPERVRLRAADTVPIMHPLLKGLANKLGLCSPFVRGMSLRYGIFIRSDCWNERKLVVHELAHTAQYERLGGIRAFLRAYLFECLVTPGYPFGSLEQEAEHRTAEVCD
jgi:hypothetical protein